MKFKTRTILQELNSIAERRDTEALIQSRAKNIIESAVNLIASIHKNYPADTTVELVEDGAYALASPPPVVVSIEISLC